MSHRPFQIPGLPGGIVLLVVIAFVTAGCDGDRSETPRPEPDPGSSQASPADPPDRAPDTRPPAISAELLQAFPDLPTPQDPGQPILLEYHPKPGDRWRYQVQNNVEMDAMGMVTRETDEAVLEFECLEADEESFQVTARVISLVLDLKTPGGSLRVDSVNPEKQKADPPFRLLLEIWEEVLQCSPTYHVNRFGLPTDFQVPERIEKAIGEDGREQLAVTAESLSGNFIAAFIQTHSQPVSVGEQWEIATITRPLTTRVNVRNGRFLGTAEVEGRELGLFELKAHHGSPEDNPFFTKFDFNTTSLVMFDLAAGNIWQVFSVISGETELQINKALIPQTSRAKSVMRRIENDKENDNENESVPTAGKRDGEPGQD